MLLLYDVLTLLNDVLTLRYDVLTLVVYDVLTLPSKIYSKHGCMP